jgi:outer membrane receptor protein involved in Fe transport
MTLPRLTLLAAALTPSAFAQQADPATPAKIEKVEVRAAADGYDARREDTASKIVVGHDEIVKYGDTSVLDVFKRLPGVTVSGNGRGGEVRMRGLGSGYTQILVNGERAPAGFSMEALAPDAIERIEIMRAATAEFSTQAIAGTINIVLRKTVKVGQRELKLGLAGGAGSVGPDATLLLSDRVGKMSYSVTINSYYSHFKRESPSTELRTGRDGALAQDDLTQYADAGTMKGFGIAPRLHWTLDNGDTITSQSYANLWRYASGAESDTVTRFGTALAYPYVAWDSASRTQFQRSDLTWVKKLDAGAKLELKIGASHAGVATGTARGGYASRGGPLVVDSDVHMRGNERAFTSTGKYTSPLGGGHALAAGWDGGVNRRDERRTETGMLIDPLLGSVPDNSDAGYHAKVRRLAGYAQDEWNVTERWSVYMGMRWEGISTDVAGDQFDAVTARSSVWSPLFQTLYKLPDTRGDQLRFALTRTYKAPSTQRLIPRPQKSAYNTENEPDYSGNPALKPELATGIDAGYEHYWESGAMVSVSASARRITDYTRYETDLIGTRYVSRPLNTGMAHTRGLELEAKFPLRAVFAAAPAIDVRASASRNWSSVDAVAGPDNRVDQQIPFSSTLGLDYKGGQLTAGASFSLRTGGLVQISDKQTARAPVARDLETYAVWKFDAKTQLRVVLSNLLARDYVSESTYVDPVRGTTVRRSVSPSDPSLRMTMEMKF